ncbi:MAG: hypothetical protein KC636_01915 [Myxococcales bacterium]|nr:hypothetical protein [Myxococcales bacterium]
MLEALISGEPGYGVFGACLDGPLDQHHVLIHGDGTATFLDSQSDYEHQVVQALFRATIVYDGVAAELSACEQSACGSCGTLFYNRSKLISNSQQILDVTCDP